MANFLASIFKGNKGSDDSLRGAEGGFVKAKTGGFLSKTTVLENDTDQTLFLRDKIGASYGGTRYKIPAKSHIQVLPLQHTFFKMIAYAVEESQSSDLPDSQPNQEKQHKTSKDTNLTIDSDNLADNKRIRITSNGSKYDIEFSPR
eukprot:c23534_g1_i1 orf=154-591(-)